MAKTSKKGGRKEAFWWLFRFMLLNSLVMAALVARYIPSMPPLDTFSAKLFLALSIPAHAFTLSLLAALPALLMVAVYPNKKAVSALSVTSFCLLVITILVDTAVFALYRFHLNGMVLELLTGGAAGEILPLSAKTKAVIAIEVMVVIAGECLLAIAAAKPFIAKVPFKKIFIALALLLFTANAIHVWADAGGESGITRQVRFLPFFKPLTARKLMSKIGIKSDDGRVKLKSDGSLRYPLTDLQAPQGGQKPNILVVMVDSLRADCVDPVTTPNINAFAEESIYFKNHLSSGNATRFGVFGFFYGVHANYWHQILAEQKPALMIDEAQKLGYRFGVFASAPLTSPEFDRTVFSSIRDKIALSVKGESAMERDGEITRRFEEFAAEKSTAPFFSFLFYDSPHSYEFPKDKPLPYPNYAKELNHLDLGPDTDPEPYLNRLKNSYNYVDGEVGKVIETLRREKLLENTIVFITGDHGEEFNDSGQGFWGHNGSFSRFQAGVPLMVRWPGKGSIEVERLTSHEDVAPSVIGDIFGVKNPPSDYSNGQSLFDQTPREFVTIGSWDSFALAGEDFFTVVLPTGEVEYRDGNYHPSKPTGESQKAMVASLEQMGRFFAK